MRTLSRATPLVCLSAWCVVGGLFSADAQEWTRFRGPNGTGISQAQNIPAQWTEDDYNWKVKLPGIGHSSPVVWGEKVFLLSADPKTATRYVLCLRADDGALAWKREFLSSPHHLHARSSYASCTPAVDAERVYIAWSTPQKTTLMALDHDGSSVWEKDLGRWQSQHGFGTSPIVYKDLVIISNNQQAQQLKPGEKPGESYVMAFDRKTGDQRWRTKRGSVNVCYSTPCVYQPPGGGKTELILLSTAEGVYSLDPDTGKENWAIETFDKRTVASPILASGLIVGSTGSGAFKSNYVAAVRPPAAKNGRGRLRPKGPGRPNPEIVYKIHRSANYVPTPVTYGELLFLWYDKGIVTCVDAPSGKVYWQNRVGGNYSGSPIRIRDRLYCISEDGEVVVLAAAKKFQQLGRNPLGEFSRSTPAVAGGKLYLRTYSHLISLGGAKP